MDRLAGENEPLDALDVGSETGWARVCHAATPGLPKSAVTEDDAQDLCRDPRGDSIPGAPEHLVQHAVFRRREPNRRGASPQFSLTVRMVPADGSMCVHFVLH